MGLAATCCPSQKLLALTPALPPAAATGSDFFRCHGCLAPGVRLFRNLGFSAMAWCRSFAFLVPLVVCLSALTLTQQDQVDVARAELRGLDVVRPALDWCRPRSSAGSQPRS